MVRPNIPRILWDMNERCLPVRFADYLVSTLYSIRAGQKCTRVSTSCLDLSSPLDYVPSAGGMPSYLLWIFVVPREIFSGLYQ